MIAKIPFGNETIKVSSVFPENKINFFFSLTKFLVFLIAIIGSAIADTNYCAALKAKCDDRSVCKYTSNKVSATYLIEKTEIDLKLSQFLLI